MNQFVSGESDARGFVGNSPHIAVDPAAVAIRRPGQFYNHPIMKTPKINVLECLLKINQARNDLIKIQQGYPEDTEFDDIIELAEALLRGPAALEEALQKRGMSNFPIEDTIDHINHRIKHFYGLGKP